MTYREHYAGLAMLGLIGKVNESPKDVATIAVEYADVLCAEQQIDPHSETLYYLGVTTCEARGD